MSVTTSNPHEGHLQPRLSRLTMVAMAFAILNTWIALAGSIGLVLPSGGAVALLYGFIFCVLCNFALTASLGELAAIWPTAGGQYHFVYALCTEKWKRSMSFWVGWINIGGWLVVVTFICAAAVVASEDSFVVTQWSTYLIFLAILTFATIANIFGNRILGRWNDAALCWSVLGVVIIGIILLAMSKKADADFVFTNFDNQTDWSDGMAWILGLLQSALSLIGFDVVLHMAEEMPNPAKDAPRAMIYAIAVGGVTGGAFILIMLFCLADPASITSTATNMPIVELILQATKSRAATTILTLMLGICFINGTNASITSVSRLLFAMARDKGIIFHDYFSHIQPGLNVPVRAIILCFLFNVAFGLLYLGPTVAFGAYISSCTILLNVSYAFPVVALLIRGRGVLREHQTVNTPFKLGRWGYVVNYVASIFVIVTSVFFCFPPAIPVSGNTMNYVCVVIGIFVVLIALYWAVYGSRFEGPKFDVILGEQAESIAVSARCHMPDDEEVKRLQHVRHINTNEQLQAEVTNLAASVAARAEDKTKSLQEMTATKFTEVVYNLRCCKDILTPNLPVRSPQKPREGIAEKALDNVLTESDIRKMIDETVGKQLGWLIAAVSQTIMATKGSGPSPSPVLRKKRTAPANDPKLPVPAKKAKSRPAPASGGTTPLFKKNNLFGMK
ncbi:hypothetical protein ACJ41O_008957 [Fusarium nematophilum]